MAAFWTVGGALASIAGMVVTILQARKAQASRQSAETAVENAKSILKKVQLSAIAERMKNAQDHIREISPDKKGNRGFKYQPKIDALRREFDTALSSLPRKGAGNEARKALTTAQERLNKYNSTLADKPDADYWQCLQISVQDAISILTTEASQLGDTK